MEFKCGPSTRSVHTKTKIVPSDYSILPPIVENAAFAFKDLETWRAVALHELPGDTYSRNSNPTERQLDANVAALEGAQTGLSFSTGMSAITLPYSLCLTLVSALSAYETHTGLHTYILHRYYLGLVSSVRYAKRWTNLKF